MEPDEEPEELDDVEPEVLEEPDELDEVETPLELDVEDETPLDVDEVLLT